jgi:hypothetical protein
MIKAQQTVAKVEISEKTSIRGLKQAAEEGRISIRIAEKHASAAEAATDST